MNTQPQNEFFTPETGLVSGTAPEAPVAPQTLEGAQQMAEENPFVGVVTPESTGGTFDALGEAAKEAWPEIAQTPDQSEVASEPQAQAAAPEKVATVPEGEKSEEPELTWDNPRSTNAEPSAPVEAPQAETEESLDFKPVTFEAGEDTTADLFETIKEALKGVHEANLELDRQSEEIEKRYAEADKEADKKHSDYKADLKDKFEEARGLIRKKRESLDASVKEIQRLAVDEKEKLAS